MVAALAASSVPITPVPNPPSGGIVVIAQRPHNTSMATTFDQTSAQHYEFVHGRRPRGVGEWSFTFHRNGASTQFAAYGSYTDARREAVREARRQGCDVVTVNT